LHIRYRLILALACATIAATQAMAQATPASPAVASVNGVPIPKALFDVLLRERMQQGAQDNEQLHNLILNELVSRELVVQDAARKGLSDSAVLKAQIESARQLLIVRAYLQDLIKTQPVSDDALRAEYETVKRQLEGKEYKVRHILVDSEAQAMEIIAKLNKGGKFEDLASASKDSGSKDRGGDLDWNVPSSYAKPFAEAFVKLEKGKYTETPVQTQFGWHVIQLDDWRQMKTPAFDEFKQHRLQRMQQQLIDKTLSDLRARAKIE
jgi:peptidyl-prolyl cis-trans isomerase C